jgi:hypothetical protein
MGHVQQTAVSYCQKNKKCRSGKSAMKKLVVSVDLPELLTGDMTEW